MIADPAQQANRRKHLQDLADIHHRSHYGDYDDNYASFAAAYGLEWDGPIPFAEKEVIPKYASIAHDETYGAISVFDTLREALHHQSIVSEMGDTLNVPGGIADLDTNELVEYELYAMTPDMVAIVCAAVAPQSENINVQGIFCDAWPELQEIFPAEVFHKWAEAHPGYSYDEDGNLLDPPDDCNYYYAEAGE